MQNLLPAKQSRDQSSTLGLWSRRVPCRHSHGVRSGDFGTHPHLDFGDFRTLDLLRVHVDGREETVLKSLGDRLRPMWVRAIALATWRAREPRAGHVYDPAAVAELLRSRGYELLLTPTLEKEPLRNEDVVLALRRGVEATGIMTLIASDPDLRVPRQESLTKLYSFCHALRYGINQLWLFQPLSPT